MKHLILNCYNGYDEHAQETMKRLNITYQKHTPQSINDRWLFWNCDNVPNPLPKHFKIVESNVREFIGHGLSEEDAREIINYNK